MPPVREALEALTPFAEYADASDLDDFDGEIGCFVRGGLRHSISYAELRRARAVAESLRTYLASAPEAEREWRDELQAAKKQRDHECERANRFAAFIRETGQTQFYHDWACTHLEDRP